MADLSPAGPGLRSAHFPGRRLSEALLPRNSRRARSSASPRSAAGTRCAASASAWWSAPCC
ncbi:hypothetical protein ACFQ1I_31630 [Kitasatospora arboriphila]